MNSQKNQALVVALALTAGLVQTSGCKPRGAEPSASGQAPVAPPPVPAGTGGQKAAAPGEEPCLPSTKLSALAEAARAGDLVEVRKMLAAGTDPNQRNACGVTPLMAAIETVAPGRDGVHDERKQGAEAERNQKLQVAEILIKAGADVAAADRSGITALHRATFSAYPEAKVVALVSRLLKEGAPANSRTRNGTTPLFYAVQSGRVAVVRTLIKEGADPTISGVDGLTPLSLVEQSGNKAMAELLRKAGANKRDEPRAGAVALASAPPQTVDLALPFDGIWGVLQGTASNETHVGYASYALDFVPAEATAAAVPEKERKKLTDYPCFGRPVLAPADGKVVWARDKSPDPPLNKPIKGDTGNFLIIEHAPQEYTEYRHLQAKSLRVKVGDRVTKGQEIAACGNSGNAGVPHLHVGFLGSVDPIATRPVKFSRYEVFNRGSWDRGSGLPTAGQLVRPMPDRRDRSLPSWRPPGSPGQAPR